MTSLKQYFPREHLGPTSSRYATADLVISHHPTTRHVEQDLSSNSIRVVTFRLLNTIIKIFPPQHERRGDRMLESARKITDEFESVISLRERQIIEERITL